MQRLILAVAAVAACLATLALSAAGASARDTVIQFISPSGNIACEMSQFGDGSDGARCDIMHHTFHMPKPRGCPLAYGDSASVGLSGRGGATCHGDTTFGIHNTLPYGHSRTLGLFRCTSATTGMTCIDTRDRHGFFISVGSYRFF